MTTKENIKNFYENYGQRLIDKDLSRSETYRFYCFQKEIKKIARGYKRKILDIVDAGPGFGELSILLAKLGHKVTSIDIAKSCLVKFADIAKKIGIKQMVSSLDSISLGDESTDGVVCSEAIEHLENPKSALSEFARITRKKGFLLISVPYIERLQNVLCPHCLKAFHPHGHLYSFNEKKLKTMLINAGYKITGFKIINKPMTSLLLREKKISYNLAQLIDTIQPSIENKGWLFMVGRK